MSRDLDLYKRPGDIHEYSSEEFLEMMKCTEDVVYFMENYIKVQHPTKGAIPFVPYSYQRKMIFSMQHNKDTIILSPRQTGKTTVIAIYLLWFAMFHEDKKILVASNKNKNAMDIISRITFAYEELPMWLKPGVKSATAHRLTFDNGSEIDSQATTESTGRGAAVSLLLLDELAFVPKRMQEEMWASVAPTLSTGGGCVISSTPNGDNELFAHLWRGAQLGTNSFHPIEVHWDEHPDRGEEYKKEMIGKVGELKWRQEYACVAPDTSIDIDGLEMTIEDLYDSLL